MERGGLGYRDLHARQGWRLLLNPPDSPCAQVLKSKYFPDGDLLSVVEKPGISYSWRSIVQGVHAIKDGLIWRVGDGTQINIWADLWIPRGATRRPCTPRGQIILNKVSELIDPTSGDWDRALVTEIFWEADAKNILSIPLKNGMEDTLAWHFDPKGDFSVKSAYHVLTDKKELSKRRQIGEASANCASSDHRNVIWQKIWKLQCPPKVKLFFWRCTHRVCSLREK
jgi:hypothetical protein